MQADSRYASQGRAHAGSDHKHPNVPSRQLASQPSSPLKRYPQATEPNSLRLT